MALVIARWRVAFDVFACKSVPHDPFQIFYFIFYLFFIFFFWGGGCGEGGYPNIMNAMKTAQAQHSPFICTDEIRNITPLFTMITFSLWQRT